MFDFLPFFAVLVGFIATFLLGFVVIPYLKKLKFGQTILEDGPNWHAQKQGTPTMGGVMMVFGIVVAMIFAIVFSAITKGELIKELVNLKKVTNLTLRKWGGIILIMIKQPLYCYL